MTSRERIENVAHRKSFGGGMPLHFGFADQKTEAAMAQGFGMTPEEFRGWLDNDLKQKYPIEDVQFISLSGMDYEKARELGFGRSGPRENTVIDRFGCTWSIDCLGQELVSGCIEDIEDVYDYEFPSPDHPDSLLGVKEWIEDCHSRGYATVVHQNHNIFERSWAMVGYEDFLVACYTEPEAVEYLLDKLTEIKVRMAERICGMKPTLAHTGDDFGLQTGGVMSLEMFRKFFKPRYEKIWSVYKKHGIPVLHHSCGDCSQYLEDMIEIGLDMLNPVQQTAMDIRMLSERFGDSLSFFGSIDTIETLTRGTPDDVRRNVDETAEILGRNNGLLLSMLNVMPNTPFENVKAAIEQMMQYRKQEA